MASVARSDIPPISLVSRLDDGGFADVWAGRDRLGREVAIKIVRPSAEGIASALAHATALAKTNHPNVVTVYNVDKVADPETGDSVDCVVMELIRGLTLEQVLDSAEPINMSEARRIGLGMISGLSHIHKQGLTHNDLHARNIMVADDCVKIIDILYRDTLSLLSTQTIAERVRRDLSSLRFLLVDLLSVVHQDEAVKFNQVIGTRPTIEAIESAFGEAADPIRTERLEHQLDRAFRRLTDQHFVEGIDYASALMDETPDEVVFPLLVRLVRERAFRDELASYARALWSALDKQQIEELGTILGELIESDTPDGDWAPNIRLLARIGKAAWRALSAPVRIRLERILVNDLLSGRHDIYGSRTSGGTLGSHVRLLWSCFDDLDSLFDNIELMLRQDWYTQNYIGKYLLKVIPRMVKSEDQKERMIAALRIAVANDARIVVNRLSELPDDWISGIRGKHLEE